MFTHLSPAAIKTLKGGTCDSERLVRVYAHTLEICDRSKTSNGYEMQRLLFAN